MQIEKRIRCPDTSRAFGSDVDGFNRMADTLKSELDVCKGNFPEDTWPVRVAEYMATVESENMDAVDWE